MERTHRWAVRSLAAKNQHDTGQALFGIVQGGVYPNLRDESAAFLTKLPFDGFAIGGLAVGETKAERETMTARATASLPADKPRYLMGVGTPTDLIEAVLRGVDMFDCIIPTKMAQQGYAYTCQGLVRITRQRFRLSDEPLDPTCDCYMCKRFSRGYTLGLNYTYSRFEEAFEFLNGADPAPTRMISNQDVPHRLSVSGIYEVPIGRGRRYASSMNPALDIIAGGWQLSGIYTYQTGFPVGNFGNLLFTGNYDDIALPGDERTVARWFNTDAGFNKVSAQQLGSNVRTFPMRFDNVRTDNVNNVDLSVIKNATLGGGRTLQFRFDSLNAFNHPLFPGLGGNSLSPTSVQFGAIVASTQQNYARRTQVTVKFLF